MNICKPEYYDRFRCLAGDCPDSCCQDWTVQVDEKSAAFYRSLPGALGDRLRQVLDDGEDGVTLTLQEGRCPMWEADGLCRIQRELGEECLCQVCRDFPRLRHDYGSFQELGLELSCPQAAKLILADETGALCSSEIPGAGEGDWEEEALDVLRTARETMHAILSEDRPFGECLALALLYGCQVQSALDGGELGEFDGEAALTEGRSLAKPGDMGEILDFFAGLERLTARWDARLQNPRPASWEKGHRALGRYFVNRYFLQALSDYDVYSRVKFMIAACLVICYLGGDLLETAQLFSKEIENDADNLDAILDAAYTHPAFRDDRLLGLLLNPAPFST